MRPNRYVSSLRPTHVDCVICAPAAFLGSGSRFSSSLSGTEPWFPVPVDNLLGHYPSNHLIGQTYDPRAGKFVPSFDHRATFVALRLHPGLTLMD